MATNLVNLDALIPRDDFEVTDTTADWKKVDTVAIRDLESGSFFYNALCKPDFQRETANWGTIKIADFVKTFLMGDLIPALILWQSGSNIFVIDGSHRLSALIAWVNDDYGDSTLSREFFQNHIPPEQQTAAEKTRKIINKELGSYSEHVKAVRYPNESKPEVVDRANRLASLSIQVQWVTGNSKKAEDSFFKINQQATPIDKTELRILKARTLPNALAARVIVRMATGHKYWAKFEKQEQDQIELTGKEIYTNLFTPSLRTPLKTLDIPVAGRGYCAQALPLIFDFVNLANDIKISDAEKTNTGVDVKPDMSGNSTIEYLKKTRKLAYRISGLHKSSLGLHPAVYFYSSAGRYQPTAFLAIVNLIQDFEKRRWFYKFTELRHKFEEFIINHKYLPNQVTVARGSGAKGFDRLKLLYWLILEEYEKGADANTVINRISSDERFKFIKFEDEKTQECFSTKKGFSSETKSTIYLRTALDNPVRCKICNGLLHVNSISTDHITRREDGGLDIVDNGQLSHPYCNTGFKEKQQSQKNKHKEHNPVITTLPQSTSDILRKI